MSLPGLPPLLKRTRFVHNAIAKGRPVAVSCGAGCGRTGTVLACYLVSAGYSAEEAIQQLLALRPCAREIIIVRDSERQFWSLDVGLHRAWHRGPSNQGLQPTAYSLRSLRRFGFRQQLKRWR